MAEEMNNTPQMSPTEALIQALEQAQAEPVAEAPVQEAQEEAPVTETPTFAGNPMAEAQPETQVQAPAYATLEDIKSANQDLLDKILQGRDKIETTTTTSSGDTVEVEVEKKDETDEEMPDFDTESFMNTFYDNPAEAVKNVIMESAEKIADKKVKKVVSELESKLQPLLSQSEIAKRKDEVTGLIKDFLTNNEDGREYFGDMTEYIKSNNLDPRDPRTYNDAYKESKLNRQARELLELRQNQGKSLDDYLNDDNEIEHISANEKVRDMVINKYLKELNEGGKPATIGANSTTQPTAQPAIKPTTVKEAGQQLAKMLG